MNVTGKGFLVLFGGLVVGSVQADSYQSFSSLGYTNTDHGQSNHYSTGFNTTYYFDKRTSLGPLSEFDYINTTSNIGFAASDFRLSGSDSISAYSGNNYSVQGEYFLGKVLLGGSLSKGNSDNFGSSSSNSLSLGYLVNNNLLIKINKDASDSVWVSARYRQQLSGKNYLGMTFGAKNDQFYVATKYFQHLHGDSYWTLEGTASHAGYTSSNQYNVAGNYFFNKYTSIGVSTNYGESSNTYELKGQHFINKNWSMALSYQNQEIDYASPNLAAYDYEVDTINLTLKAQF